MEAHQGDVMFVNGNGRQASNDDSTVSSHNEMKNGQFGPLYWAAYSPKSTFRRYYYTYKISKTTPNCWGCGQTCYGRHAILRQGYAMTPTHWESAHEFASTNGLVYYNDNGSTPRWCHVCQWQHTAVVKWGLNRIKPQRHEKWTMWSRSPRRHAPQNQPRGDIITHGNYAKPPIIVEVVVEHLWWACHLTVGLCNDFQCIGSLPTNSHATIS